jgi:hypothetical protein
VGINEAVGQQRGKAQYHAGWVAAWIGHQSGEFYFLSIDFRQAVNSFGQVLLGGVRLIPLFVNRGGLEAKIGAQVHNPFPTGEEVRDKTHGRLVGHGSEKEVSLVGK